MAAEQPLKPPPPDFDALWSYPDPAGTERKFGEILATQQDAAPLYRLQLLTQIARAQGLQAKFDQAHATLDLVERAMMKESDAVLRVRYLLERGRVLNSSGQPKQALPLFTEAMNVGRRALLLRFEIDAIHMIAIAESDSQKRIDWNRKGIERATAENETGWLPALYNNLGEAYRTTGQYELALECFREMIEAQKRLGRPIDRYARVDEAKMIRLLGRPDHSLEKMRELEIELSQSTEPNDGLVAEEIGESLLALGRASEAKPHLMRAYEKLKDAEWLRKSEPQRLARLMKMVNPK